MAWNFSPEARASIIIWAGVAGIGLGLLIGAATAVRFDMSSALWVAFTSSAAGWISATTTAQVLKPHVARA